MICSCSRKGPLIANAIPAVKDPTRTTMLRASWVREVWSRWADLARVIERSVVDMDAFGIQPEVLGSINVDFRGISQGRAAAIAQAKAYQFGTVTQKVDAFMGWLRAQEEAGVLQIVRQPTIAGASGVWSDTYVQAAYRKGVLRGKTEVKKGLREAGIRVDRLLPETGREISGAFLQPIHAERIGVIYSRSYEKLQTAVTLTNDRLRTELVAGLTDGLALGLAEGKHPRQIAREIARKAKDAIAAVGRHRATLIARTETIAAHHKATMAEYRLAARELADEGLDVRIELRAELSTAADPCPQCDYLSTFTYTLDEADGLIPVHPQCRCAAIPKILRKDAVGIPGTRFGARR